MTLACEKNLWGQHIAKELVWEQSLENLQAFSDRLHRAHAIIKKSGQCTCIKSRGQ